MPAFVHQPLKTCIKPEMEMVMLVFSGGHVFTLGTLVHTVHQTWIVFVASNAYVAGNCVSIRIETATGIML